MRDPRSTPPVHRARVGARSGSSSSPSSSPSCRASRGSEREGGVAVREVAERVEHRRVDAARRRVRRRQRRRSRPAAVSRPSERVRFTHRVGPFRLPSASRRARSRRGSTTETGTVRSRAICGRDERDERACAPVGDRVAAVQAGPQRVYADPVDARVTGDGQCRDGHPEPERRAPSGRQLVHRHVAARVGQPVADGAVGVALGGLGELVTGGDRLVGDERRDVDVRPWLVRGVRDHAGERDRSLARDLGRRHGGERDRERGVVLIGCRAGDLPRPDRPSCPPPAATISRPAATATRPSAWVVSRGPVTAAMLSARPRRAGRDAARSGPESAEGS